jgi:hypothetical protein
MATSMATLDATVGAIAATASEATVFTGVSLEPCLTGESIHSI